MEKEYKETQSPDDRLQEKPDWQAIIRQARRDGWMVCYHPFYGWLLEKYVGPGPKVVVPGWIASLCEGAFGNRGDLTGITLQGRLKFIDSYAFSGCTGLTSVTIPKSVSEIRCDAFYNCTSLAEIKVDPENKYYRAVDGLLLELRREWKGEEEDGNEDFNGPAGMKTGAFEEEEGSEDSLVRGDITSQMYEEDAFALSSIIPRGYGEEEEEDWEDGDWKGCETYWVLHSCPLGKEGPLAIPEGIRGICESAFSGCTGLTRVTIPEGVLEIGKAAFCRCTSLAGAVLPKSVCRIGPSAFLGCANLAHIEIPEGNTFISPFAFSGCTGLAGVVLPKGIIQICEGAFKDCIGLTGVTFPQSVILIEKSAFYGCTGLTDAVIPEGVIKIGREAFSGCTSLRTAIPETGGNDLPEGNEFDEGYYCFTDEFHVDEEDESWEHDFDLLEDFLYEDEMGSEEYWSQNDMAADILKGAAEIKPRAFAGWIELRKADIPEGVTKIGDDAFWNCWRLDRVVIPKSVTAIGQRAFRGCTGLAEVELPEGIQEISSQTFKNCTSLSHIAIPESNARHRAGMCKHGKPEGSFDAGGAS